MLIFISNKARPHYTSATHHIYTTEKMFDAASQSIPIVDLSSPTAADDLLNAAVTFGFIFVKHNDDMPLKPQDVNDMFSLVREFPRRGWCPMYTRCLALPMLYQSLRPHRIMK